MAKYCKKPVTIEATQWHKNGDHPQDECKTEMSEGKIVRRFRNPDVLGRSLCASCGYMFHYHGWIDIIEGGHNIVCPGDWIITHAESAHYPCKPDIFGAIYAPFAAGMGEEFLDDVEAVMDDIIQIEKGD